MTEPRVTELTESPPTPIHWIADPQALADLLPALAAEPAIAVDTEFMREDTYFPKLALIQVGLADQIALIDPACCEGPLGGQLMDALRLAVLHSPGEDYGVFMHALGRAPAVSFDTQIAAAFAGYAPNLGLRDLLRQVLGIDLAKDQTRSDWLKRPLSPDQLRYAADDVRHLLPMQRLLDNLIADRGQQAWCADECRRLRELGCNTTPDPQPHWQFKRADELDQPGQLRLYRLLHWRETRAREIDKPRGWIVPPPLLWLLAERGASSAVEIERMMLSLHLTGGRRRAESLLTALHTIDSALEDRFVAAPTQLDGIGKKRFQELRTLAELRARDLKLPIELLAPRRLLEPLARDGQWPTAYLGWREEALGAGMVRA